MTSRLGLPIELCWGCKQKAWGQRVQQQHHNNQDISTTTHYIKEIMGFVVIALKLSRCALQLQQCLVGKPNLDVMWNGDFSETWVLSSLYLLQLLIVWIIISMYWLLFCQVETQPFGKAEPSNILEWVGIILPSIIYLTKGFNLPAILLFMSKYKYVIAQYSPIMFLKVNILVKWHKQPAENILTNSAQQFLVSLNLHDFIVVRIINHMSAWFLDLRIGQTNPGQFCDAHTSLCSGVSGTSKPLPSSTLHSFSASQISFLMVHCDQGPCQFRWFSVS